MSEFCRLRQNEGYGAKNWGPRKGRSPLWGDETQRNE